MTYDLICIGAGPTGLACAIEARRAGMRPLVIDKGCLCNSIHHYPANMVFFTTPELLEIGDLPLTCAGEKPTRTEALKYYRKAAEHYELEVRLYERVERVEGSNGRFVVHTKTSNGLAQRHEAGKIVVASGYYDLPNRLNAPGEDLPHVSHYYTEPHAYWNQDVVVIGGKNSAAEAALDLYRAGARVRLVHRRAELGATIKYWVRPDIENRIGAGQIRALFESRVTRIEPEGVCVEGPQGAGMLPARQVFALTGYHPDFDFLRKMGIAVAASTNKPSLNPETLESNVPGIFLAGVVAGATRRARSSSRTGDFTASRSLPGSASRGMCRMRCGREAGEFAGLHSLC